MRVWRVKDHFLQSYEDGNHIYLAAKSTHEEIAFYNTKTNCLYFNTKYRDRFSKAKSEIKKAFKPSAISQYTNLGDMCKSLF